EHVRRRRRRRRRRRALPVAGRGPRHRARRGGGRAGALYTFAPRRRLPRDRRRRRRRGMRRRRRLQRSAPGYAGGARPRVPAVVPVRRDQAGGREGGRGGRREEARRGADGPDGGRDGGGREGVEVDAVAVRCAHAPRAGHDLARQGPHLPVAREACVRGGLLRCPVVEAGSWTGVREGGGDILLAGVRHAREPAEHSENLPGPAAVLPREGGRGVRGGGVLVVHRHRPDPACGPDDGNIRGLRVLHVRAEPQRLGAIRVLLAGDRPLQPGGPLLLPDAGGRHPLAGYGGVPVSGVPVFLHCVRRHDRPPTDLALLPARLGAHDQLRPLGDGGPGHQRVRGQ
ncbi:unnamed protein product, partial [Ectocarpus sp. 12 AP-2014]